MRLKISTFVIVLLCLCPVAKAPPIPPFTTLFMRTVLDDATALAARTTLGIGEGDSPTLAGLILYKNIV